MYLVSGTTIRDYIVSYLKEQVLVYQNQLSNLFCQVGWTKPVFVGSGSLTSKDKGDLKGFQTNFETLFLQVSVTIWHLSIRERVSKKKALEHLKNNGTSLARTVTTMFSSKTVNDLTESIIHSHRRFIHVRRFTSVHYVNGEESNCE